MLARTAPLGAVEVPVEHCAQTPGLVLARDVAAAAAVPAFDNSAMDGYAVRLADLPADGSEVTLPVVADVRPGPPPDVADPASDVVGMKSTGVDGSGTVNSIPTTPAGAVRIMTGAALPAGFDAVVPVERTSTGRFVAGGPTAERTVTLARQPRDHVRRAATDLRPGDLLARAGTTAGPGLVAAAAAAGLTTLAVHRRPRVAVISTGSELADLGTAAPGTIPDSNSLMLAALARDLGADVVRVGAVPDHPDALRAALDDVTDTARPADLVVTSGGVSAGASDVVREVLASGAADDVELAAVAMRPGRPQAVATWRGVPWIAVPGNPVSAFVSFTLFVRPALRRLAGHEGTTPVRTGRAATGWTSPPGVEQVLPVTTGPDGVTPAARDGHHLAALPRADALVIVPAAVEKVVAGDPVAIVALDGESR